MLSLSLQRVIFSDNGVLTDASLSLNDFVSGTKVVPNIAAQDAIYIGSELPFNHRFFEISVANSQGSSVQVHLWDGSGWSEAVDVVDDTLNAVTVEESTVYASLGKSGYITWTKDKNKSWVCDDTDNITGLTTLNIYGFYWAKISFSANISATTALSHIGFKFANDSDLECQYVDLNLSKTKTNFKSGKSTWNEQHYIAADEVVKWLRRHRHLWSANQVFDYSSFTLAAVHKTAQIIFSNFGPEYRDVVELAVKRFNEMMNQPFHRLDKNGDGVLEKSETRNQSVSWVRS